MFDPHYAVTVGIPVAQAAYDVMNRKPVVLPNGFELVSLIEAGIPDKTGRVAAAMLRETNVFGVVLRDGLNVYVSFRGTTTIEDWIQDLSVFPTRDGGFGEVADGFFDVYQLIRDRLKTILQGDLVSGDNVTVVGHSLGGALATFAALDIATKLHTEPSVLTFGSPHIGMHGFATTFNTTVESCFHVTNFLDVVPHVPPFPYMHAGTHVRVNSGGPVNLITRHLLPAYATGLTKLIAS